MLQSNFLGSNPTKKKNSSHALLQFLVLSDSTCTKAQNCFYTLSASQKRHMLHFLLCVAGTITEDMLDKSEATKRSDLGECDQYQEDCPHG